MTKRTEPSILQNFDTEIAELIAKNRGISIMDALRIFLASKTHEMLENDEMKLWYFSPLAVFDMWENEDQELVIFAVILYICEVMRLSKEFRFFTFLIESYAREKNMSASDVLKILDEKNLTDFIFNMYEIYHVEAIENAYMDIDSLIKTGKTAW